MSFGDIESVDGDLDFNENCVLGRNIDIAGYVGYLFNFAYLYACVYTVFHSFPYMICLGTKTKKFLFKKNKFKHRILIYNKKCNVLFVYIFSDTLRISILKKIG